MKTISIFIENSEYDSTKKLPVKKNRWNALVKKLSRIISDKSERGFIDASVNSESMWQNAMWIAFIEKENIESLERSIVEIKEKYGKINVLSTVGESIYI